ncbi:MAG: helix-turn-helix transcriptional regulator [Myxococcales bacterium]
MHIGQRIAQMRRARGVSAQQLARNIKRDPQTISRWERGLSVPDANDLERIASVFECPVGELFNQLSRSSPLGGALLTG